MKAINDQFPDEKDISPLDAACSNSYLVPLKGHSHKNDIASLIEHGSFIGSIGGEYNVWQGCKLAYQNNVITATHQIVVDNNV
eukprot:10920072-Ditylum_brightwellii.AAC.1